MTSLTAAKYVFVALLPLDIHSGSPIISISLRFHMGVVRRKILFLAGFVREFFFPKKYICKYVGIKSKKQFEGVCLKEEREGGGK